MTVDLIVRATVLLSATLLALFALRRASAATRHLVGTLGLLAALALPLASVALPRWELPVWEAAPAASERDRTSPTRSDDAARHAVRLVKTEPADRDDHPAAAPVLSGETVGALPSPTNIDPFAILAVVWAAGALFVIGRLGLGWYRVHLLAVDASPAIAEGDRRLLETFARCCDRIGIRRPPRLLLSPSLHVPVLCGILSPVLILPRRARLWSAERLRVVLLHELAHLRRRDGVTQLLGRLSVAVWWFQPAAWWVEARTRHDRERACDDLVVRCGERPSDYARQLLQIAGELPHAKPVPVEALSMLGTGSLERRLSSILSSRTRRGVRALTLVGVLALFVAVAAPLAVAQPVERDAKDRRDGVMLVHDRHDRGDSRGERLFDEAFEAHEEERWSESARLFQAAADAGYRPGTSLYNAACAHARMGHTAEALERIERAMDAGFDDVRYLFEDADLDPIRSDPGFQALLERVRDDAKVAPRKERPSARDRYVEAAELYEDLVAGNSDDADAWYDAGSDLLRMREFDRAIDALERANRLDGGQSDNALYNLACAHSLAGDTSTALDTLERAVLAGFDSDERFENDSDLDNIRDTPRFREIRELHDTLGLDRFRNEGSWLNRSRSEYSERRWAPAVEEMRAFVAANPDVGRAWSNLGWALHHSRRFDEAREAFLRQRDLGYQPRIATYNVACTHAMQGNADAAFEWLGRAVDEGIGPHQLLGDDDLDDLHRDARWKPLLEKAADGMPYEKRKGVLHRIAEHLHDII